MTFASKVKELSLEEKNNKCIDCNTKNTQWASLSYGIFLCMECASIHRSFGVRISVVKSINMDKWTEEGYLKMKYGGNDKFKEFLMIQEIISLPISEKYKTEAVKDYKKSLQETVNKELPEITQKEKTQSRVFPSTPQNRPYIHSNNPLNNYSSSTSDLKSTVSSAIHKFSEFVSENAIFLKDKGVQYGSKLNESVLRPSTTYLKEKGKSLYGKLGKEDKKGDSYQHSGSTSYQNKKIHDPSKWD